MKLKAVQTSKEHDSHGECHLTGTDGIKWLVPCGITSQESSWGTWEKDSGLAKELCRYWGNSQRALQREIKGKKAGLGKQTEYNIASPGNRKTKLYL